MKLHVLGCGGYIPAKNETSCFLVEHKNQLIMLDAGTGVSNLRKYKEVLDRYDTISVILSHFHLDHIIGLIYIIPFIRDKKLNIYGPGKPAYEKSTHTLLNEMMQFPFFVRLPDKLCPEVHIYDYSAGDFDIGDIHIGVTLQRHNAPSFRINIDGELVYATDTTFDKDLCKDCGNAKYLLHECVDIHDIGKVTHTSLEVLSRELEGNSFEKVLLVHQNPEWTDADYENIADKVKLTNIELMHDFTTYLF